MGKRTPKNHPSSKLDTSALSRLRYPLTMPRTRARADHICEICGKKLSNNTILQNHLVSAHGAITEEYVLSALVSAVLNNNEFLFLTHYSTVIMICPYPDCGYFAYRKDNLKRHVCIQ